MKVEATVYKVLAPVRGTSARGEWTKQEVIFEQADDFKRKVCISFWGDKAAEAASLREGEKCEISVNVESREYNGRWYTEVRGWQLTKAAPAEAPMPSFEDAPMPSFEEAPIDDMPF